MFQDDAQVTAPSAQPPMRWIQRTTKGRHSYFYLRHPNFPRTPLGKDRDAAARAAAEIIAGKRPPADPRPRRETEPERRERAYRNAVSNAVARLLPGCKGHRPAGFALTLASVEAVLEQQGWRCAITGLKFDTTRQQTKELALRKHPFAPSIDRINATGAYIMGNVRVVCLAVNVALGSWGDEVFMRIARAAIAKELLER